MTHRQLKLYYLIDIFLVSIFVFLFWNYWIIIPIFHLVAINFWQAIAIGVVVCPKSYEYVVVILEEKD